MLTADTIKRLAPELSCETSTIFRQIRKLDAIVCQDSVNMKGTFWTSFSKTS